MIRSSKELRGLGGRSESMEAAADEVVSWLYECFIEGTSKERCNALVRCFKTHLFDDLPESLKERAQMAMGTVAVPAGMRCLALLASRGDEAAWNGRLGSVGHQVIPLVSQQSIAAAPMIAQLVRQMKIPMERLLSWDDDRLVDLEQPSFEVFHVEDTVGSSFVPAQDEFVKPYGVQSVLGLGGLLPSGDVFALLIFSKVRISTETAALFRTLALSVKLVLLPHSGGRVFAD